MAGIYEQITDKAISYIGNKKRLRLISPSFYITQFGAVHAPHQVDTEWSDLYKENLMEAGMCTGKM
jgi:arylsulfatase